MDEAYINNNFNLIKLRENFEKIAKVLAEKNDINSSEVFEWSFQDIEKNFNVNIDSRLGDNKLNKLKVEELQFIIKKLYPKYKRYIDSLELKNEEFKVKIVQSDLLTLYREIYNYKVPFYAKQREWEYAYVRVDEFINGIAIGVYFKHSQYKNRKKDFIYKSRDLCWIPIVYPEDGQDISI